MTIPWALILKIAVQVFTVVWPLIVDWWKKTHPTAPVEQQGVAKFLFSHGDGITSLAGADEMPAPESPADLVAKLRAKLEEMRPNAPLARRPALRLLHWAAPHMGKFMWEQLQIRGLVGPSFTALKPEPEADYENPKEVFEEVSTDMAAIAAASAASGSAALRGATPDGYPGQATEARTPR